MKRMIKDYFTFSKKERVAVIILLLLIAFFIAAPYFYSVKPKPPVLTKVLRDYIAQSKTVSPEEDSWQETTRSFQRSPEISNAKKPETFSFDPNTVSEADWKRLGINDKTIRTIFNYRNKGGKFRSPEDLHKIWGFRKEDAERLIPFIHIPESFITFQTKKTGNWKLETGNKKAETKIIPIDINTATLEEWKSLPGIGDVLANRIIKFRERAGGFTTIEQVHKTYGISDSVFKLIDPYLQMSVAAVQKLNLNTTSAYELKTRIGIPENIARAIIVYRQQYGLFQSVSDLKKIIFITDSLFQQIAPRLKIE